MMHHHPVKSSRIISVAYDDASATLEIYFLSPAAITIYRRSTAYFS